MPKCFKKIWYTNFDDGEIIKFETSCGIYRTEVKNCSFFQTTTSYPTKTIPEQTTQETLIIKIPLNLSAPIMGVVFVFLIVLILFLAYKARYDFKNQFSKNCYYSLRRKSANFKEMNTISFISPLN